MLSFRALVAQCPAAATEGKARRTTHADYVSVSTRRLFKMATDAGFKCVDAVQGPSLKRAYVPFARHLMVFDKTPDAGPGAPPRFRLVITNSHNGLTPIMFIPALYVPVHDVTLYASAFAVFHRDFNDAVKLETLVAEAFDKAVAAETAVMSVWRKLCRASVTRNQASRMFTSIVKTHGGCLAHVPPAQLEVNGMSAGNVAAATLSGYTHGRFKSKTAAGKERAIYSSRAIVRIERVAFGAWFEACRVAFGNDVPELVPFNVTPVPRAKGEGSRRKSAPVILTGVQPAEAAAD